MDTGAQCVDREAKWHGCHALNLYAPRTAVFYGRHDWWMTRHAHLFCKFYDESWLDGRILRPQGKLTMNQRRHHNWQRWAPLPNFLNRYRYFRYLGYLKPLPLLRYCFRNWESATRYSAPLLPLLFIKLEKTFLEKTFRGVRMFRYKVFDRTSSTEVKI